MAKSACPVSKTQFLEKAEAVKIVIGNSELVADKREFSTGSFGWYYNGKISITVDGKPLSVQCGINLTVRRQQGSRALGCSTRQRGACGTAPSSTRSARRV